MWQECSTGYLAPCERPPCGGRSHPIFPCGKAFGRLFGRKSCARTLGEPRSYRRKSTAVGRRPRAAAGRDVRSPRGDGAKSASAALRTAPGSCVSSARRASRWRASSTTVAVRYTTSTAGASRRRAPNPRTFKRTAARKRRWNARAPGRSEAPQPRNRPRAILTRRGFGKPAATAYRSGTPRAGGEAAQSSHGHELGRRLLHLRTSKGKIATGARAVPRGVRRHGKLTPQRQ